MLSLVLPRLSGESLGARLWWVAQLSMHLPAAAPLAAGIGHPAALQLSPLPGHGTLQGKELGKLGKCLQSP